MKKFCNISIWLGIFVLVLLSSIDFWARNDGFYRRQFTQNQVAETIGISEADLIAGKDCLIDYLIDKRQDLGCTVQLDGETVEMFNEKEQLHMVDVKNLYQGAMLVRNSLFFVIVLLGIFQWKQFRFRDLSNAFKPAVGCLLLLVATLAFYAWLDFTRFWIQFHYLFFTNELFFLNPQIDRLIMMVPEPFFIAMVQAVVITTVTVVLILGMICKGVSHYVD